VARAILIIRFLRYLFFSDQISGAWFKASICRRLFALLFEEKYRQLSYVLGKFKRKECGFFFFGAA
jgi:hypothetical protein